MSADDCGSSKRLYGLCLVGLDDDMQQLIMKLVPAADTFTFPSPGFSLDIAKFLENLNKFYTERKDEMKRVIIISCGSWYGQIFIKEALVIANQTRSYQELTIIISHLIFLSTPSTCENLIWDMISTNAMISEPWRKLVTQLNLILTKFRSIGRKYDITNLLPSGHASIDVRTSPHVLGDRVGMNVELEGPLNADAIYSNVNDLIRLYNCLAPLPLLDNDTVFEVSPYINCLERLSWSWRPITEDTLLDDTTLVDTKLKAKLISQLNLHEYESGRYPTSVCLFGPSGCGRTSFLRSFTLGLEGYKDVIIVAFEKQDFQASDPSIVDILKSFSHQILCHVPSAFSRISRYYQFLGNQDVWTEQLLWSFVLKLLRGARRHKLILLIDDIGDWLSPFRELLQTLEMLSQSSSFGLQVICTATVDQPSLIPGQTLSINMAEEGTWQDVSEILKTRLIDNKIASESIENDIDRELQANPGNCLTTYLYLKQISRLSTLTTPSILGRELPKLPHGREDIYKAEIEMLVSKDQDILQWSWSSLSWLVQAIHPLTIPELSVAVALHQTGSDMSKSDIRNHIPANMWDYLDRHLGLLVYRDGQRLVKVHDTAKEFIRCHSNTTAGKGCRLASHAEITILCLRYLETVMATCNNSTVEEHSEYGFMRYTVEYWPRHYHLATEDGRVNETGLDQHVLEFLSRHETCIPWFKRYQTTASRLISVDPTEADGFEVACGLGQASIVSRMLGEKTPDGVDDKLLQRSLNTALKNNQSAVVPILLHAGARSELALCFAAERNIVSAVDQLLEHDKGLEETSSLEKAITSAATYGCLQAIVRLCDHCTNPNELVRIKRSALDRAVTGGHASIVSFLLLKPRGSTDSPTSRDLPTARRSEGVDFALRDLTTQYKSALDIAAASGHADIIFLLLEAGAKATNSALEIASKQQSIETVRLLAQALMSQNCITNSPMALHFASEKGYLRIVTELLNHGMDTNCRDDCNQTPLHKAAKRGHKDIVRLLLQRGANRTACDDQEVLPCHLAAQGGHIETLKALHEDPEASHDDFLVVCAAKGGHFLMVRYLLSLKSMTLNKGDQNTLNSALLEATSRGYLSVVRELCEVGLNPNSRSGTDSPLHLAASRGYAEIVSYLITKEAKVWLCNEYRQTPLHLSIAFPKVVLLLLRGGADPNADDLAERRPLHVAATLAQSKEVEESVQMLLGHGAEIDSMDQDEATPLLLAAANTNSKMVDLLLKAGANPNFVNSSKEGPLHSAVKSGTQEEEAEACVRILLDYGAEVNVQDSSEATPLHWAAFYGLVGPVKALLEKDADLTISSKFGRTPFAEAVLMGHLELAQLLLAKGSNINIQDRNKITPLYQASRKGILEMVRFLLDNSADLTLTSIRGWAPLSTAASYGQRKVVELLLQRGADINHRIKAGNTPLHLASWKGFVDVVEVLLTQGASVNAIDTHGKTPLHLAAEEGHLGAVQLLLDSHAYVSILDLEGNTPLKLAKRNSKINVAEILERAAQMECALRV